MCTGYLGHATGGIRIYECHPGLVSKATTVSPLMETIDLLPRIARNGPSTIVSNGY